MNDYVIGVDIGTGSVKALAVDTTGLLVDSAQVFYPTLHPRPSRSEQVPDVIWRAFVEVISRITGNKKPPTHVVLSAAMHSLIPCDDTGNALTNMILWSDNRSAAEAVRLKNEPDARQLYEETGTPIHAMSPLCKILWIRAHDKVLFANTARFISIKEYIWFRLFGVYEVDISIASATGLMHIGKMKWNAKALGRAGIQESQLSSLVSTTHSRTGVSTSVLPGIGPSTAFVIGASDGCFANVGSFAVDEGVAALTIGTSGAIRVASQRAAHRFESMLFNYRLNEDTFICGGPVNNGGAALQWYIGKMLAKDPDQPETFVDVLGQIANTRPGSDGLVFLPYLDGERAPLWNSHACGTFFGVRSHHTQAHFTRAVVEGISMALFDIAEHMVAGGLAIRKVHVSGGFIRSREWLQILADIFGVKMTLLNTEDASAMGACYLGLKMAGVLTDYNELQPAPVTETLPRPEATVRYREQFRLYRELYTQLNHFMR